MKRKLLAIFCCLVILVASLISQSCAPMVAAGVALDLADFGEAVGLKIYQKRALKYLKQRREGFICQLPDSYTYKKAKFEIRTYFVKEYGEGDFEEGIIRSQQDQKELGYIAMVDLSYGEFSRDELAIILRNTSPVTLRLWVGSVSPITGSIKKENLEKEEFYLKTFRVEKILPIVKFWREEPYSAGSPALSQKEKISPPKKEVKKVKVVAKRADIRAGPSMRYPVIKQVGEGKVLEMVGEDDGWVKVKWSEVQVVKKFLLKRRKKINREGWISKNLVEIEQ